MKASQTFEISGYKYRPGSRIKVTVRKVTSAGVLVRTEDGAPGVIRRYELSWDRDISDAEVLSIVSIGQELEAVVLGPDEEQRRVMLSLRRVDYEPWEVLKAEKDQWIKAVVRGEVVSLQSYGAFVELADIKGAEGLLHISGIPGGKEKNIEDLLWVGDYVEAVITEIDVEERHLRLSINSRLARNDSRTRRKSKGRHREGEGAVDDASQTADPVAPPGSTHTLRLHKTGKIKKILLIDDAVEFVKAFGRLLLSFGYPVDIANTGEEGFERSLSGEHDLIFLDVHLPDTSGVNVARRILQQNSKAKIVLVTGLDWLERDLDADGLGLVGILLKPLDSNEVIQILQALEAGREVQTPNIVVKDIEQEDEFLSQILPGRSSSFTLASELGRLLGQLCKSTHADNAIVFKIDVVSRRVSVVASNHQVQTHEDALHDLRYSPVKDVAWDRAAIFENDVYRTA
ncbi:MAG: S1 RNA-binding domain-containing protein, partial [Sedimentisphaerales bacterium]|nr:S1 RNA-binding domain-containing protein [Sedimentisphaerales bacterium]